MSFAASHSAPDQQNQPLVQLLPHFYEPTIDHYVKIRHLSLLWIYFLNTACVKPRICQFSKQIQIQIQIYYNLEVHYSHLNTLLYCLTKRYDLNLTRLSNNTVRVAALLLRH